MWSVPAGYLDALAHDHGMSVTVNSFLAGQLLGTVPVVDGVVRVTATNRVRRRLELLAPEAYWPVGEGDPLFPYGAELRVDWTLTTGRTTWPSVPVFCGRVERVARVRKSGLVRVEAADRFAQINDEAFESPRPAPRGHLAAGQIAVLIRQVYPDVFVHDITGSTATIPAGIVWDAGDGSRGKAIDELALAIAAEVVANPDGSFTIRPVPTLDSPSAWTVKTGEDGVIVGDGQEQSRVGVANRWLVQVERADSSVPLAVPATVNSGPLRYGGPYGRVTRTYRNPVIDTTTEAAATGQAILARIQGMTRQRTVEVIANPALDGGDVLTVITDDGVETHIADGFGLPLTAQPPTMAVATRSGPSELIG